MNKEKASVLIAFDSMRFPNTGFFYFGKSLAQHLIQENRKELNISLYTHPSVPRNILPVSVRLINKALLHKVVFPYKFDLTHFSDQYCHPEPGLVKGKKILTLHDINPLFELEGKPAKRQRYIKKIKRYIKLFDHIVAISNFTASQISRYFPESEGKVSVIYNGADKLPAIDERHEPAYRPINPYLFTIGILSPRKNFHVLPALLEKNQYELVIAGIITEDYKEKILYEARKYNCLDRVKIIGTINEVDKAWYYKNCLAFVFPSLAEGFGLPVIEAMYFGKPVFLSTFTSLPEIGGEQAFYFKSFDPDHMQDVFGSGMVEYNDPAKRFALIKRAEEFDWKKTANDYLELYKSFLYTR